jgi:hypothetical protein
MVHLEERLELRWVLQVQFKFVVEKILEVERVPLEQERQVRENQMRFSVLLACSWFPIVPSCFIFILTKMASGDLWLVEVYIITTIYDIL